MTTWDLQEWRMVVKDLLSAMEAHDIAHFVEAGHPQNYEACVAASDALQVAQIRALAMLKQTEPIETPEDATKALQELQVMSAENQCHSNDAVGAGDCGGTVSRDARSVLSAEAEMRVGDVGYYRVVNPDGSMSIERRPDHDHIHVMAGFDPITLRGRCQCGAWVDIHAHPKPQPKDWKTEVLASSVYPTAIHADSDA